MEPGFDNWDNWMVNINIARLQQEEKKKKL